MRFVILLSLALCLVVPRGFSQAVLRPGDVFEIRLTGMPAEYGQDFNGVYTVNDDGNVTVPYIGPVKAVGANATQVGQSVDGKLVAAKLFTHPTAIITLQQQSRTVTIGGGVRAPEALPWSADLDLRAAVFRAGGPTDFANLKKIKIFREGKNAMFNLTKADRDPAQNPKLLPGDVVEVLE